MALRIQFFAAFCTLICSSGVLAEELNSTSITKLRGKNVHLFTDGRDHFVMIPKVSITANDGRAAGSGDIFYGKPQKMAHARHAGASSSSGFRGEPAFAVESFKDGGVLRRDFSPDPEWKLLKAGLTCGNTTIALTEVEGAKADAFAQSAKLELHPGRLVHQMYRFTDGRLLVVDYPVQAVTPESYRYWIGTPGNMTRLATYPNTNFGQFKDFKASAGVTDKSGYNDTTRYSKANWIDGTTRERTEIERLIKYYPEVSSETDSPKPTLAELKIPGLSDDVPSNSICDYFLN